MIAGLRAGTELEMEPCQPLDYSFNNPLDLSRTEPRNPALSLLREAGTGRNFNLAKLENDWSDHVRGKPWRYSISDDVTAPATVDLLQPDCDPDSYPAQVSLSEGEDHRETRGFSDSEELYVFQAPRSEIKFLNIWSFSRKYKSNCDKSRYSHHPGQALNEDQPKQSPLLEAREDREDYIELVDQTGSPSHSGLLLEHERSILCDPELQMFPISQPTDNCPEQVLTEVRRNEEVDEVKVATASPAVPEIVLPEIPSPRQLPVSDSESDREEFLEDDLLIDLQ